MSKRPIPTVAADFSDVLAFLKEQQIINQTPAASLVLHARHIHELTFSLILWRFRLKGLPDHAKVFLEEIASDALQILPQVLMGYGKTSKLLIRGIIENTLRHIYFSDHPIEYGHMNRDKKWYVNLDELSDYAKKHPHFCRTEQKFNAIDQLSSLYSDLSGGVHGRTVRDLEMRTALRKIRYDEAAAGAELSYLRKTTAAVNFLIAIFHSSEVRRFSTEDRRVILRSMPKNARETWSDHE